MGLNLSNLLQQLFADLTDVTLADEDANSIPNDKLWTNVSDSETTVKIDIGHETCQRHNGARVLSF